MLQSGQGKPVAPGERCLQHLPGEVFAAIQRRRLGFERDRPERLQGIQRRILDRLHVVGAGQVQGQHVATRQQRQVERLRVDAEAMPRAELDDVAAFLEQVAAIAQRAHRIVPRSLDARLDVIGLHRIPETAQAACQLAQLLDQRITGEEGVEFVRGGETVGPSSQSLEDAHGRVGDRLRLALPLVEQRLLVALECLQQLLALAQDVAEELFVLAELALELLELDHQPRQVLVRLFRRGRHAERTGDRLAEQAELRAELGHGLGRPQRATSLVAAGLGLVEAGVERRQHVDDPGALGRVLDLQGRHQFGEHVEVGRHRPHVLDHARELRSRARLLRLPVQRRQPLLERRQRLGRGQEATGRGAHLRMGLHQRLGHGVDRGRVDVAVLADRQQSAAERAGCVDRVNEFLHLRPGFRLQPAEQRAVFAADFGHRGLGLPTDLLHLLELVQHRLAGGGDFMQERRQSLRVRIVDPVMRVEQVPRGVGEYFVALRRDLFALDVACQVVEVGNGAHEFGIADPAHEARARRPRGREFVAGEGRVPDLHLVHAGRIVVLGVEQHHAPVLEPRIAMGQDRGLQPSLHQVVDQQRRQSALAFVEHVHHVFAVGRTDGALVLHAGDGGVESLVLAVLQVVAPGKDDAVVFGQLDAGLHDRIQPDDLAGERVEHQSAPRRLPVRQDLQQDQRTDARVLHLRIVQRLGAILDRFTVDAGASLGIVLDLDGEVAAGRFDEQRVEDVQVRETPADLHVLGRPRPFEIERARQRDVAFAARVDVGDLAAAGEVPAEHAHIGGLETDLERRQQLAVLHQQLQEPCILVVGVQLGEVALEAGVGQEAGRQVHRRDVVAVARLDQPVQAEHVGQGGGGFQAEEDVVAEQQHVADLDDVSADGVLLATDAQPAGDLHARVAELLQPLRIERVGDRMQASSLLGQPLAQHFVRAALGNGAVERFGGSGGGNSGVRHGASVLGLGQAIGPGTPGRGVRRRWARPGPTAPAIRRACPATAAAPGSGRRCPRSPCRSTRPW